jgi:hypothetical protein
MRWVHALGVLAVNAVPLYGLLRLGWSPATVLVLFWCETVLLGAAHVVRLVVHRRQTRLAGHWLALTGAAGSRTQAGEALRLPAGEAPAGGGVRGAGSYLGLYARLLFGLAAAHGIFLAFLLGIAAANQEAPGQGEWALVPADLGDGLAILATVVALELVGDLVVLRDRSFTSLKRQVEGPLGRTLVMHLALIFGFMATVSFESPLGLLGVLVGLKALLELGTALGGRLPERPPVWFATMARLARRDPRAEWESIRTEEARRSAEWNAPRAAGAFS